MLDKLRMDVGHEQLTDAVPNQIDKMETHLVLIRKAVGGQTYRRTVIADTDQQRPPTCVEKSRKCLKHCQLYLIVRLTGVEVRSKCRFELDAFRFSAYNELGSGRHYRLLRNSPT